MRQIILFFVFQLTITQIFSQHNKLDKSINIDGSKTTLYSKENSNLVVILSSIDSIQKFIFKSSQGNLQNLDSGIINGLFYLSNLELGNVTLSVFRQVDTGLQLKNYKTYKVIKKQLTQNEKAVLQLSIKPEISLEGFTNGKLPLQIIKSATKFTINKPYKIKNLTIYVGSNSGFCSMPIVYQLTSERFDESFKNILKRMGVGSYIQLDNIKIADLKGKEYILNPINFLAK